MYFEQIVRTDIGCAAYLIGSANGEAVTVDPRIDMVDEVLRHQLGLWSARALALRRT